VEICKQAVGQDGFSGIYMDSFGKGAPECYDPTHGHPIGGGKPVIEGQRAMAKRVRDAIRAIDSQAIMSGEDPVEAFRDLLDVNLYAVNVTPNYRPIYRVVWGDYSLGHGRVLASGAALAPESAVLFLEGTIPGRIYCEGESPLLKPEQAEQLAFLKRLTHFTHHGLEYLRMGEYLRPLELDRLLPTITFTESVEKQKVALPAVLNSVTRSHRDGSVAVVLVNIDGVEHSVMVPIDPTWRGEARRAQPPKLSSMAEDGTESPLPVGDVHLTLAPSEVAFLILR
jgi:hypothetical protein